MQLNIWDGAMERKSKLQAARELWLLWVVMHDFVVAQIMC